MHDVRPSTLDQTVHRKRRPKVVQRAHLAAKLADNTRLNAMPDSKISHRPLVGAFKPGDED